MAQRGRPPKPVEQKRALGNPGKRALPDQAQVQLLPQVTSIPEPRRPLLKYGRELWDEIWENGVRWISSQSDIELFLMTCEMVDERWNLRVRVMQDQDPRDRRALRALDSQIVNNLQLLGFTPTDRTRLGVAEVAVRSRVEELAAMRARLRGD